MELGGGPHPVGFTGTSGSWNLGCAMPCTRLVTTPLFRVHHTNGGLSTFDESSCQQPDRDGGVIGWDGPAGTGAVDIFAAGQHRPEETCATAAYGSLSHACLAYCRPGSCIPLQALAVPGEDSCGGGRKQKPQDDDDDTESILMGGVPLVPQVRAPLTRTMPPLPYGAAFPQSLASLTCPYAGRFCTAGA